MRDEINILNINVGHIKIIFENIFINEIEKNEIWIVFVHKIDFYILL
jgi:hypothetical protein